MWNKDFFKITKKFSFQKKILENDATRKIDYFVDVPSRSSKYLVNIFVNSKLVYRNLMKKKRV